MRILLLIVGCAAAFTFVTPSVAQTPSTQDRTVAQRHDELAKVKEALADPDPLQRLATMEDIIASGDATRINIALRTALSSDDPAMRNLAMRTWVAGPEAVDCRYRSAGRSAEQADEAMFDTKKGTDPFTNSRWLRFWAGRGFQASFGFVDVDVGKNTGRCILFLEEPSVMRWILRLAARN